MAEVTLQEYTQEIDSLIENNAYDEAIAHCKHILQQRPKYIEPYRLMGKAAWNREDYKNAADMFTRVLSADPSDFVSRAGLAVIYDKEGSLPDAVWQMERAYELEPGNEAIQEELRVLYARRGGVEPDRVPLTRGALARLYMNGELYSEAAAELRALLEQEPDRVDLQVLLAEALWRGEQRLEASEITLKILDKMPYCLDANLILGGIWMHGGREEDAQVCLERAAALDPEGNRAKVLFGKSSPLPATLVEIPHLDYAPPAAAEVIDEAPTWLAGIGEQEEATGVSEEIPSWLQGIGLAAPAEATAEEKWVAPARTAPEEQVPDWLSGLTTTEAQAPVSVAPEEEEAPEWLAQLRADVAPPTEEMATAETRAAPQEAEIPDWLQALKPPAAEQAAPPAAAAELDWLSQLRAETEPEPSKAAAPEAEALPDWLSAFRAETEVKAEPTTVGEEEPEWLAQLHAQAGTLAGIEMGVEPEMAAPEPGEIPDWLRELKPEGVDQVVTETEPEIPGWMQEPARAAEALAPSLEQAEIPDWLQEIKPGRTEAEAPVIEQAEILAGLQQLEPQEAEEQVPELPKVSAPVQTTAPAGEETLAWMAEGGGMPSPEEAMAFFAKLAAGKEAELQAQAQAEAEARMAEITGRKREVKPAPTPEPAKPPIEAAPVVAAGVAAVGGVAAAFAAKAGAEAKPTPAPKPEPKPVPPRPTPVVQPEPPKVEAPAPTTAAEESLPWMAEGGGMPTPEEAMAFFAKLAAGKEVELEAQAQAEAEARMAEITGRKPRPKPVPTPEPVKPAPKPVEAPAPKPELKAVTPPPTPVVPPEEKAPTPTPVEEEIPSWMAEGGAMPTPEEAMAFFARLTAGKETQLQAQEQAEAEVRMAEITGRKPEAAPKPGIKPEPAPVIPPSVTQPPVIQVRPSEPVAKLPPTEAGEETQPAFLESISEWLAEPAAIEAAATEAAPLPEAQSGWQALVQTPMAAEWPLEEITPAAAAETAFSVPELPVAEKVPAEAVPTGRQPFTGAAGPDWWYQTLEDEEGPVEVAPEQVTPELGAVPLTEVMLAAQVTLAPKPAPVREAARKPGPVAQPPAPTPAPAKAAPKRLVRAKPGPAVPPKPIVDIESIMARLRTNPDDAPALLDMARAWVQLEDMSAARGGYNELIRRNVVLDDVISDLERIVEDRRDDVDSLRLLGDAHMKAGHLQQALKLYRQALKKL